MQKRDAVELFEYANITVDNTRDKLIELLGDGLRVIKDDAVEKFIDWLTDKLTDEEG